MHGWGSIVALHFVDLDEAVCNLQQEDEQDGSLIRSRFVRVLFLRAMGERT